MGMVRIAVVGDVHGEWDAVADEKALQYLKPDLVMFTGDFGDEDVNLVKDVAKIKLPKAVILGNHDCGRAALGRMDAVYDRLTSSYFNNVCRLLVSFFKGPPKPAVEQQIETLGDSFVGFKRADYPHLKLSVIGARPFAMGGGGIHGKTLVSSLFGIEDMKASAEKIAELALGAPKDHALVFLGHNGPTGLGSGRNDICGKDFSARGGDNGDPDLAEALESCQLEKRSVPLVVFGHMHKHEERKMVASSGSTVYVNGAVVPRKVGSQRQFTLVELRNNRVEIVNEVWIDVDGCVPTISNVQALYP